MTDTLSQDEIMNLLDTVDAAYATDREESQDSGKETHIDKFSRKQIRAISKIHEKFAHIVDNSLSAQLRSRINMVVASMDQLTMGEFFRTIPVPAALGVISMEPLNGSAILEIDPSVAFAIIDRVRSGKGELITRQYELTDKEKIILKGIYVCLLENLREAWSDVLDLRPRLDRIETDPRFIKIDPPSEGAVLVTLETKIENAEGNINLCIPYPVIEPVAEKLST